MNGQHEVRACSIDPSVAGEDREMLEDLVVAAINDAVRKVEATTQEKFAGMMARHAAAARVEDAVLTP